MASQAEKYALIIAAGDYPESSGWGDISSVNDVDLIKSALSLQGFTNRNISVLINEQATKAGILSAFMSIKAKLNPGDVLVVHFSGHGQQVFDDNGDEVDNLDEALVPIDALATYSENYKGENHLRDDELGNIIKDLRNRLGKKGQLLFLLDSCHSGASTRGAKTRGGNGALVPPNWKQNDKVSAGSDMIEIELSKDAAPFVMIAGASSRELNYEYKGNGSLSLAFAKAVSSPGTNFTYRQLFNKITAQMATIAPRQKPTIEGDIDYILFDGQYIQQQPYYAIGKVTSATSITVDAGSVQQFNKGTTVYILPSTATKFDEKLVLANGIVTRSMFNESRLTLDKALPSTVAQEYIVFVNQIAYPDIQIKIYTTKEVDKSIVAGMESYLKLNNLGILVNDINEADVVIDKENGNYLLKNPSDLTYLNAAIDLRGASNIEKLQKNIFTYAQGSYIRNLELSNPTYELTFKLVPVIEETESKHRDVDGVFKISPNESAFFEVTNNSNKDLYFTVVEVYTDGKILPMLPSAGCDYSNDERMIPRNSTKLMSGCEINFGPPYERIVLKGFASTTPINLEPIITKIDTRSALNPLEDLIKESYVETRGAGTSRTQSSGSIKGFTSEFVYEIVEKL